MSIKKTVSFQDYVLEAADKKAKELFGNSLSNYLSWLICNDNKEIIERILEERELKKPQAISEEKSAKFGSVCPYCGRKIKVGDLICDVILPGGIERFVHKRCCRE